MVLLEAIGTFSLLATLVILRDPVLMYVGLLAM